MSAREYWEQHEQADSSSFDNATATVSGDFSDDGPSNAVGVLLLAIFALAINLVLFLPAYFVRRRRHQDQLTRREAFRTAQSIQGTVAGGDDKDERYHMIESWVVSKKICAHDEICEKVCQLRALDNKPRLRKQTMSTVDSIDTDEGNEDEEIGSSSSGVENSDDVSEANGHECPICFDTFQVDDIVSWSASPACRHIFHHRCLKEWLVKNKGCPFCRETFLPVDRTGSNLTFANLSELMVAQEQRSLHCYYCVDHGVVSLPKDLRDHLEETDFANISHRAQEVPDRSILSSMRGPVHCMDCDIECGDQPGNATSDEEVASTTNQDGSDTAETATLDTNNYDDNTVPNEEP